VRELGGVGGGPQGAGRAVDAIGCRYRWLAIVGALAMLGAARAPAAGASDRIGSPSVPCSPAKELRFVCGAHHPEDLVRVPGTGWVIVSGFEPGGGISLLDTRSLTLRRWYTSASAVGGGKRLGSENCPGPPDAAQLDTQGLSIRALGPGRSRLYAVNHGDRESIEIIDVILRAGMPLPMWRGCVLMPPGDAANAVASYADGTILATVLNRPGSTKADFVRGKPTGGVYEWHPGAGGFHLLPGTELPGNNGLETSPDGRFFYVVAFGTHQIVMYSRHDTRQPVREATSPGFMPDNIRWEGHRLIAAGMIYDEPACGGIRRIINGRADPMLCHRGYVVAAVDPRTLRFTVLAYAEPNPEFNGVTTGLIVGSRLWLGSYQADRLAYRDLPGAAPADD
jgi:hypothetical protein